MMLKAMGLDPERLKADVEEVRRGAAATVSNFDLRLIHLESRLDSIEQLLVRVVIILTPEAAAESAESTAAAELGAAVVPGPVV
jgi:hypothetical protein